MDTAPLDLQSLTARVEKLEKQNRLVTRGSLAILLAVASSVLMGLARPARTITAEKFLLVDSKGATSAELGSAGDRAHLWLYDGSSGKIDARIVAGNAAQNDGGAVSLSGGEGVTALLKATGDGAVMNLFAGDGKTSAHLGVGTYDLRPSARAGSENLLLFSGESGPSLVIKDNEGFSVVAGSVNLKIPEIGESRKTSAASLRLFGKDGAVIWSAP